MDADDLRVLFLLIVYWNLKPLFIMAKFELKFLDCGFDDNHIKVQREIAEYGDNDNHLNIDCINIKVCFDGQYSDIYLDKSTAIKFAKTLRTEINKITESEVKDV